MRDRRTVGTLLLAGALAAAAALIPGTSGAFTAKVTNSTDTAKAGATFKCADVFASTKNKPAANAYFEYALSEAAGTTGAADSSSAGNAGVYQNTHGTETSSPTACPNDTSKVAYAPAGTATTPQYVSTTTSVGTSPATFSLVVWFKTTTKGGKLIGLGGSQTGASSTYDRHVYLEPSGQLAFGTYSGGYQILTTPSGTSYADGLWHQVVATFTAGTPNTGMYLYVDGALSASNASWTTAESDAGWWRIGYDTLGTGWTGGTATNAFFVGSIKYAAAYRYVLTAAEVRSQYTIGAPG